jgi:hypothetical protein
MARLFDTIEEAEIINKDKNTFSEFLKYFCLIILAIGIIISFENLVTIKQEKKSMRLVEQIVPDNDNLVCQKVKYSTSPKVDPDDTSDIFYEVYNSDGDKRYPKGTLVKFHYKYFQEVQIEGETYITIDKKQIQFHIKPEDVKRDILKR